MTRYGLPADGILSQTMEISDGVELSAVVQNPADWVPIDPEPQAGWAAVKKRGGWAFTAPEPAPVAEMPPPTPAQLMTEFQAMVSRQDAERAALLARIEALTA